MAATISEAAVEIFYRFDEDEAFRSTGQTPHLDPQTGRPMAETSVAFAELQGRYALHVKYVDAFGITKGPYTLAFDTVEHSVKQVKHTLKMLPAWVDFRWYDRKLLAYFTTLVTYKNAIREIRFSVDDDRLTRRVSFAPWVGPAPLEIGDNDEVYLELARNARYVAVQLGFVDGTASETKRFEIPVGVLEKGADET